MSQAGRFALDAGLAMYLLAIAVLAVALAVEARRLREVRLRISTNA